MDFSVTQNGKPLDPSKYTWDEKTKTFSSKQDNLIIDATDVNNITLKTGDDCHFKTGGNCSIVAGAFCLIRAGKNCNITTENHCSFVTENDCKFKTGDDCTFNTEYNCTFDVGKQCYINILFYYEVLIVGENSFLITRGDEDEGEETEINIIKTSHNSTKDRPLHKKYRNKKPVNKKFADLFKEL